jgi:hypothetical protein
MREYFVVYFRSYGEWRSTCPFKSDVEAEAHIDRYLRSPDKDYIKDIRVIPVRLPE